MKVIIAGSRTITNPDLLEKAIEAAGFDITAVVHGGAPGVDRLGFKWAIDNHKVLLTYRADWDKYGKGAGFIRNQEMADVADALIAVWDGVSRGTKDMIDRATKKGLKIYIHKC